MALKLAPRLLIVLGLVIAVTVILITIASRLGAQASAQQDLQCRLSVESVFSPFGSFSDDTLQCPIQYVNLSSAEDAPQEIGEQMAFCWSNFLRGQGDFYAEAPYYFEEVTDSDLALSIGLAGTAAIVPPFGLAVTVYKGLETSQEHAFCHICAVMRPDGFSVDGKELSTFLTTQHMERPPFGVSDAMTYASYLGNADIGGSVDSFGVAPVDLDANKDYAVLFLYTKGTNWLERRIAGANIAGVGLNPYEGDHIASTVLVPYEEQKIKQFCSLLSS